MRFTVNELREVVDNMLSEARKKKSKKAAAKDGPKREVKPTGFMYDEAFDFSPPLGDLNVYKMQGATNIGPWTGNGSSVNLDTPGQSFMKLSLQEGPARGSAWSMLAEGKRNPKTVWELAQRHDERETCAVEPEDEGTGLGEKKIGFKALKNKLAHKKGVKDPAALAASIGRKKYGSKAFAAKSAAGRRK